MTKLLLTILLLLLAGCTAVGVVENDDPAIKLKQAQYLYRQEGRIVVADELFHQAMKIYQEKGDELGLAESYSSYAYFLQEIFQNVPTSPAIDLELLDRTITSENRLEKAKEYFLKARPIFEKNSNYTSLSNTDWALGLLYAKNDPTVACSYFQKSLDSNRKFIAQNPDVKIYTVRGFNTFEEYLVDLMSKTGCK